MPVAMASLTSVDGSSITGITAAYATLRQLANGRGDATVFADANCTVPLAVSQRPNATNALAGCILLTPVEPAVSPFEVTVTHNGVADSHPIAWTQASVLQYMFAPSASRVDYRTAAGFVCSVDVITPEAPQFTNCPPSGTLNHTLAADWHERGISGVLLPNLQGLEARDAQNTRLPVVGGGTGQPLLCAAAGHPLLPRCSLFTACPCCSLSACVTLCMFARCSAVAGPTK